MTDYRDLAKDLLSKAAKRGASGAEVVIVEDESFSVLVRMRGVDTVKSAHEKRLGLARLPRAAVGHDGHLGLLARGARATARRYGGDGQGHA